MNTFNDAFEALVKDIYSAENQVLKALPKAAKAAKNPELKAGFDAHKLQTEAHVERLQEVARLCGFKPQGKVSKAAQGMVEEIDDVINGETAGPIADAMLAREAQKIEHYQIANYGTAIAWANQLGKSDCAALLQKTLEEEAQIDKKLTHLATTTLNKEARNSHTGSRPSY